MRLRSLDVFRGLAVAGMIVVNNQGSGAHAFPGTTHAPWHGVTPADLVFPFFLVAMGAGMAFGAPSTGRILRRGVVLFAIGLALNGLPHVDLAEVHLLGVLQRIALAYVIAALVVRHVPRRRQVLVAGAILAGYWAALSLVPVPGHGAGHLSPAGNLTGYIDRTVLGARHLYGNGPSDPEGLLSTLPAVVTVLMGYWASEWLREEPRRVVRVGVVCVLAGMAWHPLFPMNKKLWTSSYVLFTGGCALLVLAGVHRLVDVGARRLVAFEALGRNAILAFVGSEELGYLIQRAHLREEIYRRVFVPWAGLNLGSLSYALTELALLGLVLRALYARRWFLTV
ncbi:MAG: DUF1624 domain-containing protein [Actinobacteria bacterium]|nr:MAG: DUF1624 domain-containing protein [Actinomycetota bacterium]